MLGRPIIDWTLLLSSVTDPEFPARPRPPVRASVVYPSIGSSSPGIRGCTRPVNSVCRWLPQRRSVPRNTKSWPSSLLLLPGRLIGHSPRRGCQPAPRRFAIVASRASPQPRPPLSSSRAERSCLRWPSPTRLATTRSFLREHSSSAARPVPNLLSQLSSAIGTSLAFCGLPSGRRLRWLS